MTKVVITVDTEVWPRSPGWPHVPLPADALCRREIDAYFWGGDKEPRLGLPYQLSVLTEFGLRATYFVDPFFSFALGMQELERVVEVIKAHNQELGLHLHPEWLTDPRTVGLPKFNSQYIGEYSEAQQSQLIAAGIKQLRAAGANPILSFRAGSWGANTATLNALRANGIRFDSSLNVCYAASMPDLLCRGDILQPTFTHGVWEFPLTYFVDRPPNGRRQLQLCACSLSELIFALETAYANDWHCVTIVSHSFELVRVNSLDHPSAPVGPMRLLGNRFRALCSFLASNRDRFQTVALQDAEPNGEILARLSPISSHRLRTFGRMASQALSLIY